MTKKTTRRKFLRQSVAATGISLTAGAPFVARCANVNSTIRVAVAGVRSQGFSLANNFQKQNGVRVVAMCDPDSDVLKSRISQFKKRHKIKDAELLGYADVRHILDRDDIDVLAIAAPNHWHALMTVWACQAGKHVYVEKPVSHSINEGRKMVEAARKYRRLVQVGTQQLSCPSVHEAAKDLQAGRWGRVLWARCSRMQARKSIGKVAEAQAVPKSVDYNLWSGPAPMSPVMRQQFHYDWHWQWQWGDGETGNWGVHYLADLHMLLGWKSVPDRVIAAGNRFAWDDNGETPNMHLALFYYDNLPVVLDIRNLPDPARRGGSDGAVYRGARDGNHIQCEHAYVTLTRGGGAAFDLDGKRIHRYKGDGGSAHIPNFIAALRANRREALNAEIEIGHLCTVPCHQANIAMRMANEAPLEQIRDTLKPNAEAVNTLNDIAEQLKGQGVDLAKQMFKAGPMLTYDRQAECFTGAHAVQANAYIKRAFRQPFAMPEEV